MMRKIFVLAAIFFISTPLWAQEKTKGPSEVNDPDSSGVVSNRLLPTNAPTLLFNEADERHKEAQKKKKKKKKKKNVFFGVKTKKSFIRQTVRDQTVFQFFHYTFERREVDPYIRDIYWIDKKDNVIRSKDFDPAKGYLLHGPYEKKNGDVVTESGMFYYGTKHGRWLKYDNKNILVDKAHYSEGWPKASRVTYYNRTDKKIEMVTPIEYELKEGNFFHFYEDGQLAVTGEFHYGEKVGLWTEYWHTKNSKIIKKREIQYQDAPYTKNFTPFIKAEWDKEGNLIYRKN
jgi:antitoxin component YwqK of YwqJK toxin-antitoxin module